MAQEREPRRNPFEELSDVEKAERQLAELYHTHKVRGSLGTFYEMYPHLRPRQRQRADEGGDREH